MIYPCNNCSTYIDQYDQYCHICEEPNKTLPIKKENKILEEESEYISFQVLENDFLDLNLRGRIIVSTGHTKPEKINLKGIPTLYIPAIQTRNLYDVISLGFAYSVSFNFSYIKNFIDQIDHKRECKIVSRYPIFIKPEQLKREFPVWQDAHIAKELEDKGNLNSLADKFNFRTISKTIWWSLENWLQFIQDNPSSKYVIQQLGNSCGGTKTHILSDFDTSLFYQEYRIAPYVDKIVYIASVNIYSDGEIHIYPVFIQNTFIHRGKIRYIGGHKVVEISDKVYDQILNAARVLKIEYNYIGPFGFDFMLDDEEKIILLDFNARMTATFSVFKNINKILINEKSEFKQIEARLWIINAAAKNDIICSSKLKTGVYSSKSFEYLREISDFSKGEFLCISTLKNKYLKEETVLIANIYSFDDFENEYLWEKIVDLSGIYHEVF